MRIEINALSFAYPSGVPVLHEVSLRIEPGETVALVGQNGAGKTTLVKHLNGLLQPNTGTVRVGDWDTRAQTVARLAARVGYVFQNPDDQLFQRTLRDEVMFGPKNLGWPMDRVRAQTEAALEQVGLLAEADRHPYDLSPGQRKRVALAAVLAMDPPILVLDEPTTGQDYAHVEAIGRMVGDWRAQGKTVITVTHDLDFCAEYFERVIVMGAGRILLDGPGRTVLAQAEILAQTAVDPPQLIRLAARLGLSASPLNVDEFVAALP